MSCKAAFFSEKSSTFRKNISPRSSRSKSKPKPETSRGRRFSLPPVSDGFLLGLLFNPENGGNMFLRNVELFVVTAVRPSNPKEF
jgi:hypothetical protein